MNSLKKLVYSLEPTVIYESDEDENLDVNTENDGSGKNTQSEKHSELQCEKPIDKLSQEDETHSQLEKVGASINSVLYTVCVHPVVLVWLLVTFPFTYIFGSEYPNLEALNGLPAETQAKTDEKAALLKEEKIIANHIKTPTAYKYILPPPPRLFPLSRNPEKQRKKKILVLDLDETLIHSLSRGAPRSLGANNSCHMIELKINNIPTLYYVYKRPFCDFFLKEAAKWFELQIFTASVKDYADPIIDWLESDIIDYKNGPQSVFTKRYYRNDCTFRQGVGYIKDLSKFCTKEEELKNVIILDNSPVSYALHEDNAIMIEGWINDPSDRDLLNILPMLYSLSVCIDVRFILGLRSGEKLFEAARTR